MALKLSLKPDERVIIGGAVLRNTGGYTSLTVENAVPVLRGKHVIGPAAADTPVRQLAFTIQMMYLSGQTEELKRAYLDLLAAILREAPSMTSRLRAISADIAEDQYYKALRQSWDLIEYERELIESAKCCLIPANPVASSKKSETLRPVSEEKASGTNSRAGADRNSPEIRALRSSWILSKVSL